MSGIFDSLPSRRAIIERRHVVEAIETAKVYWQMSRDHADTVAAAADVRPVNFTGRNSGVQKKTERRLAFLKAVATEKGLTSRKAIAGAASTICCCCAC